MRFVRAAFASVTLYSVAGVLAFAAAFRDFADGHPARGCLAVAFGLALASGAAASRRTCTCGARDHRDVEPEPAKTPA